MVYTREPYGLYLIWNLFFSLAAFCFEPAFKQNLYKAVALLPGTGSMVAFLSERALHYYRFLSPRATLTSALLVRPAHPFLGFVEWMHTGFYFADEC